MKGISSHAVYWVALAHIPKWQAGKINYLIDKIQMKKISLPTFFQLNPSRWKTEFQLSDDDITDILHMKDGLPSLSFLIETLYEQGFDIVTINSDDYSKTLRRHLGKNNSPPLLYTKGNKELLNQPTVTIVKSQNPSDLSLQFVKNITEKMIREKKILVSVINDHADRTPLDFFLKAQGKGIVVLSQGVLTSSQEIKFCYQDIISGKLLIISPYSPNNPKSASQIQTGSILLLGLADEIYIADLNYREELWPYIINGIKRNWRIYVREPEPGEKNTNQKLIDQGAIPVDIYGNPLVKLPPLTSDHPSNSISNQPKSLIQAKLPLK